MIASYRKPYLIVPKLIEQPTWGGDYILNLKDWLGISFLRGKKIGQSYELFGKSKLLLSLSDTNDKRFVPELGNPDTYEISAQDFPLPDQQDYITLEYLFGKNPEELLGSLLAKKYDRFPLLIKMTQAAGNSFQLHIKPSQKHPLWRPKAESWYYFEDGLLTFGIKPGIDIHEYNKVCHDINYFMITVSEQVQKKMLSLENAKELAKNYIKNQNPWQFINQHIAKKSTAIDLSLGGLHHSWEEDKVRHPLGNVLYEVQQDVMDPISTIRSFDQGKIKNDGSIRKIHINDYFEFLETDPAHNNLDNMIQQQKGDRVITTSLYCMDILEIENEKIDYTNDSFVHFFVKDGEVEIAALDGSVRLTKGHSCFLPQAVGKYTIKPKIKTVLLKTFIE